MDARVRIEIIERYQNANGRVPFLEWLGKSLDIKALAKPLIDEFICWLRVIILVIAAHWEPDFLNCDWWAWDCVFT